MHYEPQNKGQPPAASWVLAAGLTTASLESGKQGWRKQGWNKDLGPCHLQGPSRQKSFSICRIDLCICKAE